MNVLLEPPIKPLDISHEKTVAVSPPNQQKVKLTLLLILAAGIFLRITMLLSGKSFWGDEWFNIDLVSKPLSQVFMGSIQDVHPPLYFVILHYVTGLFQNCEWAYRVIPAAASMGVVVATYLVAKIFFDDSVALTAAALTAVSPYWLQLSNEIRSYSLFAFVCTAGTFLLFHHLKDPARRLSQWAYLFCAISAIYIEHYAWFWLLAVTVIIFQRFQSDHAKYRNIWNRQIAVLLMGLPSLALILYQAILNEHAFESHRVFAYYDIPLLIKKYSALFWRFSCGSLYSMLTVHHIIHLMRHSLMFWVSFFIMATSVFLVVRSWIRKFQRSREFFTLCGLTLFFPSLFLLVFYPIRLDARYLSFAAPVFFILLAKAMSPTSGNRLGRLGLFLFVMFYLSQSFLLVRLPTDATHKEDYKSMISYAFKNAGTSDMIIGQPMAVDYYQKTKGLRTSASYQRDIDQLDPVNTHQVNSIWILDYIDMDPAVNQQNYGGLKKRLGELGFVPSQMEIRFGGSNGLTAIHIFHSDKMDLK